MLIVNMSMVNDNKDVENAKQDQLGHICSKRH